MKRPDATAAEGSRNGWILRVLVVGVLAAAAYGNSVSERFVWDDEVVIVRNPALRSVRKLPLLLSREYFETFTEQSYRPVVSLSYFVDFGVFGLRATGYHVHNVVMHVVSAVLVLGVLTALGCSVEAAMAGAAVFAVHAAGAEVVNVPSFREDLYCLAFALAAILFFRQYRLKRGRGWLAGAAVSVLVSCFAKEPGVVGAAMVVALDVLVVGERSERVWKRWKAWMWIALPVLAYLVVRFVVMRSEREAQVPYLGGSLPAAVFNTLPILAGYLGRYLLPVALSTAYDVRLYGWTAVEVWARVAILAGVIVCAVLWGRRSRAAAFLWLWVFAMLAPVSNLLPLGNVEADRYLYLPLMGAAGLFGLVVVPKGAPGGWRRMGRLALLAAVLACLMVMTWHRNAQWTVPGVMWRDARLQAPRDAGAAYNVGKDYEALGHLPQAERSYRQAHELAKKALKERPYDLNARAIADDALFNRANVLQMQGRYQEALDINRSLGARGVREAMALNNAANCLWQLGERGEAIATLEDARAGAPEEPLVLFNLARFYWLEGQAERALELCQRIESKAHEFFEHLFLMGDIYMMRCEIEKAERVFREAALRSGGAVSARVALAKFYVNTGQLAEAALNLAEALLEVPHDREARELLNTVTSDLARGPWEAALADASREDSAAAMLVRGMVLDSMGRRREAVEVMKESARLGGRYALPCIVLAQWYHESGQGGEEVAWLRRALRRLPAGSPLEAEMRYLIRKAGTGGEALKER